MEKEKTAAELRVEKAEAELEAAKADLKKDRKIQEVVDKLVDATKTFVEEATTLIGESPDPVEVHRRANKVLSDVADMEEALKVRYPEVYDAIVASRKGL